jgi:peptidoglycan/LPS O-acetylase OafA/YrhL
MRSLQQHHLKKFDFLRGSAILSVFFAHAVWYFYPAYAGLAPAGSPGVRPDRVFLLNFIPRSIGWSGVTIFILISGFLLHLGFLKDGPSQKPTESDCPKDRHWRFAGNDLFFSKGISGTNWLGDFFSKRFWRVYPPYLLVLLIFGLFLENGTFHSRSGRIAFILHALSLENLSGRSFFAINPTFWCLALEVQLYLLYPLFLYARKIAGGKAALVFSFIVSVIWQAIGARVGGLANSLPWANSALSLWCIWCAGAWFAETFHNGRRIKNGLTGKDWLVIAVLSVAAVGLTPLNAQLQYLGGIIWIILIDWFIHADGLRVDHRPARMIILIGLCSFSIFLIHQPLIRVLMDLFRAVPVKFSGSLLVEMLLTEVVIVFIAWWMYRLIELPSIQTGGRLRRWRRLRQQAEDKKDDAHSGEQKTGIPEVFPAGKDSDG